jgi:hypothetical protein
MRFRTILAAAAAPAALAAVLLGTAGQASAATVASSSNASAYYWNPNGHALGGPQDMGLIPHSTVQFSPTQGLAKVMEKTNGQQQNLYGQTVTITGTVNASSLANLQSFDTGTYARVYFTGAGGTSDQSPQGYEGQSWWADAAVQDLSTNGSFKLTVTFLPSPGVWSDWNGKQASDNAALFAQAASHVRELGLSFGGASFFEDGVTGAGSLTITSIQVQQS